LEALCLGFSSWFAANAFRFFLLRRSILDVKLWYFLFRPKGFLCLPLPAGFGWLLGFVLADRIFFFSIF